MLTTVEIVDCDDDNIDDDDAVTKRMMINPGQAEQTVLTTVEIDRYSSSTEGQGFFSMIMIIMFYQLLQWSRY